MRNIVSPLSGIRSPFGGRSDLYKTAGFRPEFVADFGGEYYRANLARSTFADMLTFSRASSATMVDSTGTLVTVGVDEPRIGHHVWNGSAWVNEGLLHESEARTNLLLNSATLSTQDVTVTAVPHTLHFTGTGTITLSGASTAGPLVGTGAGENNRVSLTFTPSAGTLTLTVSGTVANADLEVGSTPSSHKPTSGSTATRAAETLTVPSASLPWPTPRVIGEELVTNGTFDSDVTGWSNSIAIIAWNASGYADVDRNGGSYGDHLYQDISTSSGSVYQVTFDVLALNAGVSPILNGVSGGILTSTGTYSRTFVATGTTTRVAFAGTLDFNATFSIDNISVKEINPLSVCIQMEGDATGDSFTTLRWYTDANNYITQEIGASDFTFEQAASGTVDSVTGGSITSGINVPFNIASRHGSTFINGAVDGTALTEDTTPVALPDLSSTDLEIGYDFMGTIKTLRIWADDIGDAGLEASTT